MSRLLTALTFALLLGSAQISQAHCQVPCGIYDDHARVHGLYEDVTTIEKAVQLIEELAPKSDALSQNQLIRWVTTKEQHAEQIIRVVSDYFLTQKIKPATNDEGREQYLELLTKHHAVMRAAMKCKQTVSAESVAELKAAVDAIAPFWPAND